MENDKTLGENLIDSLKETLQAETANNENLLSAEEVEKKMLENQQAAVDNGAENSAILFKKFHPEYTALVDTLSNKSLRRLAKAIVLLPIEEAKLNLKRQDELKAFNLAQTLLDAKTYMFLYTKMKHQEELAKQKQEETKETDNG